jgi:UDP-2,3-diacylglucosamine pyrophosphatase LpxH
MLQRLIPVLSSNPSLSRDEPETRRFRTLFISDVHLGARGCQAELLLDFLRHHDADTIYLVGDIVDGWKLRSVWYWPQAHNDVVQKLLRKARKGARLVYIPGNHDEFLRDYLGTHFGGIEVVEAGAAHRRRRQALPRRARRSVRRGDPACALARLVGDGAYGLAIRVNTIFNTVRRTFGFTYWSLSQWAKLKVKNAVSFIGDFETVLAAEAQRHGVDGVICGHIHHAAIRGGDVAYINCGDWVESCTAIAEHEDGRFEIIRWTEPLAETEAMPALAEQKVA